MRRLKVAERSKEQINENEYRMSERINTITITIISIIIFIIL